MSSNRGSVARFNDCLNSPSYFEVVVVDAVITILVCGWRLPYEVPRGLTRLPGSSGKRESGNSTIKTMTERAGVLVYDTYQGMCVSILYASVGSGFETPMTHRPCISSQALQCCRGRPVNPCWER